MFPLRLEDAGQDWNPRRGYSLSSQDPSITPCSSPTFFQTGGSPTPAGVGAQDCQAHTWAQQQLK